MFYIHLITQLINTFHNTIKKKSDVNHVTFKKLILFSGFSSVVNLYVIRYAW